jgi:broad specificity phosphatase PhoE
MGMTVLLLRHGETALNVTGALRGRLDPPLTAHGMREAQQLAERLAAEYPLSAPYSSPLLRARATAQAIADATGVSLEVRDRFLDIDYGRWAGRPLDQLSASEAAEFRRWERHPEIPLPGAEDPVSAQRRALRGLVEATSGDAGCVVVVTHDAILQLILCDVLRIDLPGYRGIVQHTAALDELQRTRPGWKVHLLNSTWHLADE